MTRAKRDAAVVAAVVAGCVAFLACGSKPPPRTCSTEAPQQEPDKGPLVIGMCPTDLPQDAGATDAPTTESGSDGTNGGG